jgi:hypothetical protein
MSKEIEFIKVIEQTLSKFEQSEVKLSEKNAKDILHIRGLLDGSASFLELHALVADYVNNKMTRKLFGFLPFVNDLKSQLLDILKKPDFDPIYWLQEVKRSRRNSSCANSYANLPNLYSSEAIVTHDSAQQLAYETRFNNLEKEVKEIKESNEFYKTKNDELEKVVTHLSQDYLKIKEELEVVKNLLKASQTEIDRLNLIILQKDEVITKLSSENEKLKNHYHSKNQQDKQSSNGKKTTAGIFG